MGFLTLLLSFSGLITFVFIFYYNRIVKQRTMVQEAWSGIDVQLKRRYELVPNLVETVKGYAGHERDTLEQIISQRSTVVSTRLISDQQQAETDLSLGLRKLFALAESYPDLKADKNFRSLQESLISIENDLQFARRYYNGCVRDNNILVESFPSNLVASYTNAKKEEFFEIELASERVNPELGF